jgi:hypothetical protein
MSTSPYNKYSRKGFWKENPLPTYTPGKKLLTAESLAALIQQRKLKGL